MYSTPPKPTGAYAIGGINLMIGLGGLVCAPLSAIGYATDPSYQQLPPILSGWNWVMTFGTGVLSLLLVTGSIGVLMLRHWGRWVSMVWSCCAMVMTILNVVVGMLGGMRPELFGETDSAFRLGFVFGYAVTTLVGLVYPAVVVFVLTRPSLTAAFRS